MSHSEPPSQTSRPQHSDCRGPGVIAWLIIALLLWDVWLAVGTYLYRFDSPEQEPLIEPVTVEPVMPSVQIAPQPLCGFRDNVLAQLASKYGEQPIGRGVANTSALIELLTAADGKTWTIIVTRPDGWACLVAEGQGWRTIPRQDPGTGT